MCCSFRVSCQKWKSFPGEERKSRPFNYTCSPQRCLDMSVGVGGSKHTPFPPTFLALVSPRKFANNFITFSFVDTSSLILLVVAVAYYLAESANNNNCNSSSNNTLPARREKFFVSKCHQEENSKRKSARQRQRETRHKT